MRPHLYIRDEFGNAVPFTGSTVEWARTWESQRIVKHTRLYIRNPQHDLLVSTIFLGIDHNYALEGPPILWETVILGADLLKDFERRDFTEADAISLHDEIVSRLVNDYGAMRVIDACLP